MNKHQTGFTLIELVVTIAVIAVVVAIGVPGITKFSENNRSAAQTNLVTGALSLARSEAIKRGTNVVMCDSSNATAATPKCNTASNQWGGGWIIFADDGDGVYTSGTDTLLAVNDKFNGGLTMTAYHFSNKDAVTFTANGGITGGTAGTFVICPQDKNTTHARAINVSAVGLISLATDIDTPKDLIVNDIQGKNVSCP